MKPLTKEKLDKIASQPCPGCGKHHDQFWAVSACHSDIKSNVKYVKGSGVLRVGCVACNKMVIEVAVASEEPKLNVPGPDGVVVAFTEEQRQMVLLALAKLSVERPGWDQSLSEIAALMDPLNKEGLPSAYESMKALTKDRIRLAVSTPVKVES